MSELGDTFGAFDPALLPDIDNPDDGMEAPTGDAGFDGNLGMTDIGGEVPADAGELPDPFSGPDAAPVSFGSSGTVDPDTSA